MSTEFQYDVFLSHSSKDKAVVRELAERLRQDGLKVWFDEWVLRPGDSIPAKIEEGLEHSRVLVLCMSANAFGSDWAQMEAGTFRFRDPLNKERRFIPLRLDDAPIKGALAQFLYINWCSADREQECDKLVKASRNPEMWSHSAQDEKEEDERTGLSEQLGPISGWTFQDLPDHQIRAYHRQLCDQYADLNSFDLLEMCGRWRRLAVGFTNEACSTGRHGARVVHDPSIDAVTRLLETACAARGLPNIDRLNRCLRRPDNGHLHYALALLDDLEARLRAEAIAKDDASGSKDLEKSNRKTSTVTDDYLRRRRDSIEQIFSSFEAIHGFFFKVCIEYLTLVEVMQTGLSVTDADRTKYYEYIKEIGRRLHEIHLLEGRLAVAGAHEAVRTMQQYRVQATEVNDMLRLQLPCKSRSQVNAVAEELFRRKDRLYEELAKVLSAGGSREAEVPSAGAPQPKSCPIGDAWSGLRGMLQQSYSTQVIKGILGKAGLPISKMEYTGTYKGPVLDEADKLVSTMDDGARDRFAIGCIQEVVAFERSRSVNLSKRGTESDGQTMRDLQQVLARFGHNLRDFEVA